MKKSINGNFVSDRDDSICVPVLYDIVQEDSNTIVSNFQYYIDLPESEIPNDLYPTNFTVKTILRPGNSGMIPTG